MAAELQQLEPDELCKQERYDILAKSVGYESRFYDCVARNYDLVSVEKEPKEKRRERKRKERERKRRKKMRRRQRKRKRKLRQRSQKAGTDDASTASDLLNVQAESILLDSDNLRSVAQGALMDTQSDKNVDRKPRILRTYQRQEPTIKDQSGHQHTVRHRTRKVRGKRSQKPIVIYLSGTST